MFGSDSASARQAPAANRFKYGEQTQHDQPEANPEFKVGHDNARDEQNRSYNAACQSAVKSNVSTEETHSASFGQHKTNRAPTLMAGSVAPGRICIQELSPTWRIRPTVELFFAT
jgi:hypothetical protein